jgi:HK97 family phage prohead protease
MSNIANDFTETQYKAIPGQINTIESKGIVECFVAGIGNKDSVGDICLPGCFNGSLGRRKPRVVWGHNWNEPIGKVLEIYEVGPNDPRLPAKMKANGIGGLFAKVQFNLASERGREAFANVKFFGEEQEWSIGYKTLDAVFDTTKQANMLKEVELYEVSPVLHGANQLTGTISIKSDKQNEEVKGGPCWDGYKQVGMKRGKNGNMVPNCVPIEEKGEKLRDPKGGLTAAGRAHFKRTEGANLKPGVKGAANTPEKMRRKGSFLTRFFTNPSGPMKDEKGRPTRLALSAAAWGEPVPQDASDAAKLAAKGRRMLERYENSKKKSSEVEMEEKNISIYSIANPSENPTMGRMGSIAKAISTHFGGEVAVREADSNNVVFDLMKDGMVETMRAAYHTPNESDFMFGPAQKVRVETIYLPVDSNGETSGAPIPKSPNMLAAPKPGGCGCGGACGGKSDPFSSWEEFKNNNPGVHLFIKTENMEMYEVANNVSEYHGFDVELLADGFVVPNIDWYEKDARNAVITAIENVEQKAIARAARSARGIGRSARRMVNPSEFDGDGDGFRTGRDGRDNVPYKKPKAPKMMPPRTVPQEVPEREEKPLRIPKPNEIPRPAPAPQPAPAPAPAPSVPTRVPERPGVPATITGRMGKANDVRNGKFDAAIYKERMTGASLEDVAKKYGVERIDIRRAEQRHMAQERKRTSAKISTLMATAQERISARKGPVSKKQTKKDLELGREMDAELTRLALNNGVTNEEAEKIAATINRLIEPAMKVGGPLSSRGTRRRTVLSMLRDMENDPNSPSGAPERAKERAIQRVAEVNEMTVAQARRAIRQELAAERMRTAANQLRNRRKSLSSVYVSVSEGNDISVKTALQSTIHDSILIKVEPQLISQVKQAVDTVAEYHGVHISRAENGINVFGAHELNDDSIEAISRAIYASYVDSNIEDIEMDRIFSKR